MDQNDKDYLNLLGETMALQVIIAALARQLAVQNSQSVAVAFDNAANIIEDFALKVGGSGKADHIGHALRVVEELRTVVFRDH